MRSQKSQQKAKPSSADPIAQSEKTGREGHEPDKTTGKAQQSQPDEDSVAASLVAKLFIQQMQQEPMAGWSTFAQIMARSRLDQMGTTALLKNMFSKEWLEYIPGNGLMAHRYRAKRGGDNAALHGLLKLAGNINDVQHPPKKSRIEPSPEPESDDLGFINNTFKKTHVAQTKPETSIVSVENQIPSSNIQIKPLETMQVSAKGIKNEVPRKVRNRSGQFSNAQTPPDSVGSLKKIEVVGIEPGMYGNDNVVIVDLKRRPGSTRVAITLEDAILIGQQVLQAKLNQSKPANTQSRRKKPR